MFFPYNDNLLKSPIPPLHIERADICSTTELFLRCDGVIAPQNGGPEASLPSEGLLLVPNGGEYDSGHLHLVGKTLQFRDPKAQPQQPIIKKWPLGLYRENR